MVEDFHRAAVEETWHRAAVEETWQIPEETSRTLEEREDHLGDSCDDASCTRPSDEAASPDEMGRESAPGKRLSIKESEGNGRWQKYKQRHLRCVPRVQDAMSMEQEQEQSSDEDDEDVSEANDTEVDVQDHSQASNADSDFSAELGEAMLAALGNRVCPGQKLCPRQTSVFSRLHKDAEILKEKRMQKQMDALQERIERELSEVRVVHGSTDELDGACDRLYSEADDRRARLARKQQEHQVAEDLQFGRLGHRSRSTPSLLSESTLPSSNGDCHWERMHARAQAKEARLERIRQQKVVEEIEYLQYHSVHRTGEGEPVAFDRLYHDSQQREQRKEQKRRQHLQAEADSVQQRMRDSVQQRMKGKPPQVRHSVEDFTQRMHNEALLRQQRLEEKRRRSWCAKSEPQPRMRSAGAVARRLDALYQDAARRRTCRELEREQIAKDEIEMLARTSVHNAARARIAKEREALQVQDNLELVFERVHHPTIREVMHDATNRHSGLQRTRSQPQMEIVREDMEPEVEHPPPQVDAPILRRPSLPTPVVSEVRWRKPPPQTAKQDMRPPMSARGPLTELNAGRNNARRPRPASARRTRAD